QTSRGMFLNDEPQVLGRGHFILATGLVGDGEVAFGPILRQLAQRFLGHDFTSPEQCITVDAEVMSVFDRQERLKKLHDRRQVPTARLSVRRRVAGSRGSAMETLRQRRFDGDRRSEVMSSRRMPGEVYANHLFD